MEEFDDDDFSDLYADVELQASSAISAMHRLTEMRPADDEIPDNPARGEKEVRNGFGGAEKAGEIHKICENDDAGGGGLTNLPMENGDVRMSESEDDLDSAGDDGDNQKFDDNYRNGRYDNRVSDVEFGVRDGNKHEGGQEIEEYDKKCGGIDGKEKSVSGGDCISQRKSLKYNSLNSKKRRVDEIAHNVHKSCKGRNADVGDREFPQLNFGRKYGGLDNASESCRPLDSDKCGSVQISDSVEDNHHEVSDCDSDGMTETSDDTNRRKTSSISNKGSSTVEPESSESGWRQHGRGPSCSPSPPVALRDKYIEKCHKYSKHPSSSLAHELQEAIPWEYQPPKDSKSHGIKQGTRDGRYCERQRDVMRKHSNQPKKSNDMPCFKTCWTSEYASYTTDVKRLHNRHISYGKPRAVISYDSNGNDMPYCSRSERSLTYSGGLFPDDRSGPAYLKTQYWNIHPSCRHKEGWPDGHNVNERENFLEKKISKMDHEALRDDWYHNQRRHPNQGNIERSRKLIPKYSSSAVNRRGTQFIYEGDDVHFKRRTKGDYLLPLHESDNKFVEGNYRRICPSGGRDRDLLDHRCDRNMARDRRETENSGRGKRRCGSPWFTENEVNDRRNVKHWPFPFYSSEEPCAPGRGQFLQASGPKSGVPERNMGCSWQEMHIENGRFGANIASSQTRESLRYHHSEDHHVRRRHYRRSSNTYITNESIKDDRDEDIFVRRRDHQQSQVLHLREELYKFRPQDDTMFHSEEPSYYLKKTSRINSADDKHSLGHVAELLDEREANRHRSKTMREEDCSNQFDGYHHKSIQPYSHAQMHPRYQYSVDPLFVVGRKCTMQSSRRTLEAGEDKYYSRHDLIGWNEDQKSKNFEDSDTFYAEKALLTNEGKVDVNLSDKNQQSKFCGNQQNELLDIEEGQIITEEIQDLVKCVRPSEDVLHINDKEHPESTSDGNGVVQRLDNQKIREIMVKMERRKERFKEPITTSRDTVKPSNALPDLDVETALAKLERPARKRRWSGI